MIRLYGMDTGLCYRTVEWDNNNKWNQMLTASYGMHLAFVFFVSLHKPSKCACTRLALSSFFLLLKLFLQACSAQRCHGIWNAQSINSFVCLFGDFRFLSCSRCGSARPEKLHTLEINQRGIRKMRPIYGVIRWLVFSPLRTKLAARLDAMLISCLSSNVMFHETYIK